VLKLGYYRINCFLIFNQILLTKNNDVYQELNSLIDKAILENKYIIHYGI
jgi:hypothetical protein